MTLQGSIVYHLFTVYVTISGRLICQHCLLPATDSPSQGLSSHLIQPVEKMYLYILNNHLFAPVHNQQLYLPFLRKYFPTLVSDKYAYYNSYNYTLYGEIFFSENTLYSPHFLCVLNCKL